MRRSRAIVALAAALAATVLTGCTEQAPTVQQGNGAWQEYRHATTAPVSFSGPELGGGTFSSSAYRGGVMVVNFWYAACGPCNAEAKTLNTIERRFASKGVHFVGINVRDDSGTARPFVEQYGVRYPTVLDQANSGAAQLAFAGSAPLTTTPTTLVVGKKGRVTGSIIGEVDPDILSTLIQAAVSGRDS